MKNTDEKRKELENKHEQSHYAGLVFEEVEILNSEQRQERRNKRLQGFVFEEVESLNSEQRQECRNKRLRYQNVMFSKFEVEKTSVNADMPSILADEKTVALRIKRNEQRREKYKERKLQSGMNRRCLMATYKFLKDLTIGQDNDQIKVRVTREWQVKSKDNKYVLSKNYLLLDEENQAWVEKAFSNMICCPSLHFLGFSLAYRYHYATNLKSLGVGGKITLNFLMKFTHTVIPEFRVLFFFPSDLDYVKSHGTEILESFVDPVVNFHREGHTVRSLDEKGLELMLSFLEKIQNEVNNQEKQQKSFRRSSL